MQYKLQVTQRKRERDWCPRKLRDSKMVCAEVSENRISFICSCIVEELVTADTFNVLGVNQTLEPLTWQVVLTLLHQFSLVEPALLAFE